MDLAVFHPDTLSSKLPAFDNTLKRVMIFRTGSASVSAIDDQRTIKILALVALHSLIISELKGENLRV